MCATRYIAKKHDNKQKNSFLFIVTWLFVFVKFYHMYMNAGTIYYLLLLVSELYKKFP